MLEVAAAPPEQDKPFISTKRAKQKTPAKTDTPADSGKENRPLVLPPKNKPAELSSNMTLLLDTITKLREGKALSSNDVNPELRVSTLDDMAAAEEVRAVNYHKDKAGRFVPLRLIADQLEAFSAKKMGITEFKGNIEINRDAREPIILNNNIAYISEVFIKRSASPSSQQDKNIEKKVPALVPASAAFAKVSSKEAVFLSNVDGANKGNPLSSTHINQNMKLSEFKALANGEQICPATCKGKNIALMIPHNLVAGQIGILNLVPISFNKFKQYDRMGNKDKAEALLVGDPKKGAVIYITDTYLRKLGVQEKVSAPLPPSTFAPVPTENLASTLKDIERKSCRAPLPPPSFATVPTENLVETLKNIKKINVAHQELAEALSNSILERISKSSKAYTLAFRNEEPGFLVPYDALPEEIKALQMKRKSYGIFKISCGTHDRDPDPLLITQGQKQIPRLVFFSHTYLETLFPKEQPDLSQSHARIVPKVPLDSDSTVKLSLFLKGMSKNRKLFFDRTHTLSAINAIKDGDESYSIKYQKAARGDLVPLRQVFEMISGLPQDRRPLRELNNPGWRKAQTPALTVFCDDTIENAKEGLAFFPTALSQAIHDIAHDNV